MAPSSQKGLKPWTSHLIGFLAGIVLGVLIQPFFVPDQKPQFFVPDIGEHPHNCPICQTCEKCSPCPDIPIQECELQAECEECPVCPDNDRDMEMECSCPDQTSPNGDTSSGACPVWWDRVSQDYLPEKVSKKFEATMSKGWWFLGCKSDVDEVLDFLKNFYRGPDKDGVFVDIGANLGQVTENFVQTFGNIPWNRYKRKFGLDGLYCKNDPNPGAEVYMFEPQPNNARRIRERMEFSYWGLERIKLIEAAVSNYSGTASFGYASDSEYTETGSLGSKRSDKVERKSVDVEVVSFDDAYERHLHGKKIFMMKTDTEGFDGTVIRGMKKVLASGKLRFLTFEYHTLWFENETGDSLKSITTFLEEYGYFCYFIFPQRLLPISGEYWQDKFEMRRWSNVFCGKKDDFLLEKLVIMYHIATLGSSAQETNAFNDMEDMMKFFFTGEDK